MDNAYEQLINVAVRTSDRKVFVGSSFEHVHGTLAIRNAHQVKVDSSLSMSTLLGEPVNNYDSSNVIDFAAFSERSLEDYDFH